MGERRAKEAAERRAASLAEQIQVRSVLCLRACCAIAGTENGALIVPGVREHVRRSTEAKLGPGPAEV